MAGTYFFLAVAGVNSGFIGTNAVFVPYLLTIVYLFISELYAKANDPINNWAYTMFGQMYIALPLSMINVLAFRQAGNETYFYYLLPLSVFIFLGPTTQAPIVRGRSLANINFSHVFRPQKAGKEVSAGVSLCCLLQP